VERSDTHHVVASPCWHARMTGYRRSDIAGGGFFFTVNLAERRLRLLTQHIDQLRTAFREMRRSHPFAIDAMAVLTAAALGSSCGEEACGLFGELFTKLEVRAVPGIRVEDQPGIR
jgi:hypothetical protein